jgi:hypothetical protein
VKRTIIAAAVLALGAAGAGVSLADPGPNGHNNYGLCQAYFSGSQTGQDHKHQAGPFAQLEQDASDANQSVADWCAANAPKPGGGN